MEQYEVSFWIKDGEYWKKDRKTYYAKDRCSHDIVKELWMNEFKEKEVQLISVSYI
jgi:hypothetical protein